jgi:cytochrome P450
MFSSLHSQPHSARKRMMSHIFSKSTIHASPALASQAKTILYSRLLPIIDASTHPLQIPQGIDVHEIWTATAMDFITAYEFGLRHSTNFLKNVAYRQHWLELFRNRKPYAFYSQELPQLTKFMHVIGIRLVPRSVDSASQEIEDFCASMCKAATAALQSKQSYADNPGDEPVALTALLSGVEKETKSNGLTSIQSDTAIKYPELLVASEILDQLVAGQETSGITLTYLTWHLCQDLALQDALRAELLTLDPPMKYPLPFSSPTAEKAFHDGQLDWLEDIQLPSSKQLDSLPILHAVIMETLRLRAALPGAQPRLTPYPSCKLAGYEIPGGVRVSAQAWSLHRNVKVFPYPDIWDHKRWLDGLESGTDGDTEARKERDRWFWSFSSGGRMCIGSNFAMYGKYPHLSRGSPP